MSPAAKARSWWTSPAVVERTLDAGRSRVWEAVADPTTYPSWLVGAKRTWDIDERFPAPGASFEHAVGPGGPLTRQDSTDSEGVESGRELRLAVHASPFHAHVRITLETAGRSTVVRFAEQPYGVFAPLTPLLRPALRRRNRSSLDRLDELLAARP